MSNDTKTEESETIKMPVDGAAEDARRHPEKYSSEVLEVLRGSKGKGK